MNSTELSKYIWQLRDSKKDFNINGLSPAEQDRTPTAGRDATFAR